MTSPSSLSRNQSTRRRTSARSAAAAGISASSPSRPPRVSLRYSAITEAPTIVPSVSSTRTGSVPAGLSARNSSRRSQGVSLDERYRFAVFGEYETDVTRAGGEGMVMKNRHQREDSGGRLRCADENRARAAHRV